VTRCEGRSTEEDAGAIEAGVTHHREDGSAAALGFIGPTRSIAPEEKAGCEVRRHQLTPRSGTAMGIRGIQYVRQ